MPDLSRLYAGLTGAYTGIPYRLGLDWAPPPFHTTFYLTYRCNYRCRTCFFYRDAGHRVPEGAPELDTGEVMAVIRQVPRHSILLLTGGEPFARADIEEILARTARLTRFHIVTNGSMADPEMAERLVDLRFRPATARGLLMVGVSIHGPEPVHDAFTRTCGQRPRALAFVERLVAARLRRRARFPLIALKTMVAPVTAPTMATMLRQAQTLGVDIMDFLAEFRLRLGTDSESLGYEDFESALETQPAPAAVVRAQLALVRRLAQRSPVQIRLTPPAYADEGFAALAGGEFDPARFFCRSLWGSIEVSPYGDVYPCLRLRLGSVRERPLAELWNSPAMRAFRHRVRRHGVMPACMGCCFIEQRAGKPPAPARP